MNDKLATAIPRKLLRVSEVSLMLNISRARLYALIMSGEIRSIKIGAPAAYPSRPSMRGSPSSWRRPQKKRSRTSHKKGGLGKYVQDYP